MEETHAKQLATRLRAQIQFGHFNEVQVSLGAEVAEFLELIDLIDRHNICVVRRVGQHGGYERVAYNGVATGFGITMREAVEDCVRQIKECSS